MRHISTALARPRVRAGSLPLGCERGFWRAMSRQDARRHVTAARAYDRITRAKGSRNGALGHVALEILDYLANIVSAKTGQLDPSYETMQRRLKRSKSAITDALKALKAHGFLDWLRRHVPTGNANRGPQIRQTSNAYRLSLPPRAARLLPVPPPPPDVDGPERVREPSILDAALEAMRQARERNTGRHGQVGAIA